MNAPGCDKATYFTFGTDENGQYEVEVTCNGMPDCGWHRPLSTLDYGCGVTDAEMAVFVKEHREFRR